MNKLVIAAVAAVAALLCYVAATFMAIDEQLRPLGATVSISVDVGDPPPAKREFVATLERVAADRGLFIVKPVVGAESPARARDLFVAGPEAPEERRAFSWYDGRLRGDLVPLTDLGSSSMAGKIYLVGASDADLSEVEDALGGIGVAATSYSVSTPTVWATVLLDTGAGPASLAGLLLLVLTVAAWSASRARRRALLVLHGEPLTCVVVYEGRAFLRLAAPAGLLVSVCAWALLLVRRGPEHLPGYLVISSTLVGALVVGGVLSASLSTLLNLPRAQHLAERSVPRRGHKRAADVLRSLTMVTVALALPALVVSVHVQRQQARGLETWEPLSSHVVTRLGGLSIETQKLEHAAGEVIARTPAEDSALSYVLFEEDPGFWRGDNFDGLVIVDQTYLELMNLEGDVSALEGVSDVTRSQLQASWDLWSERPLPTMQTAEADSRFLGGAGAQEFSNLERPLVLVVPDVEVMKPAFVLSAMSTGNILFEDAGSLATHIADEGLGSSLLSIERVADVALLQAQQAERAALLRTVAVGMLVTAWLVAASLGARVYWAVRATRLTVNRTAGRPWLALLRTPIIVDVGIALAASAILLLFQDHTPVVLVTASLLPFIAGMVSAAAHRAAAQAQVISVLTRASS